MTRIIAPLIGLGFAFVLVLGLFGTITTEAEAPTAEHEFHLAPKHVDLASNGLFGKFDRQQLQRGFQVFKEVCAACHSIDLVAFRDLSALGYTEAEVKAIADQWAIEQPGVNPETGEAATRKNLPSDKFPKVYANEVAARAANNNAIPPDLSLLTKARPDGANYLYSLLTGYQEPSAELKREFPNFTVPEGLHHNPYFPTLNLAMPQPLSADGQVTYADGTAATVDQMAKDVTAFLVWTAEPKLEARHQAGLAAVIFLIIFIALTWGAYKSVWRNVKH
ncbi:cytochrome c1 [Sphingomonas sp. IW22]|uniref:cytochrome c1 n=1 Tax=Sphingomonas sp. IW22 TaxID=3242489 RepID=UPI00351F9DA9